MDIYKKYRNWKKYNADYWCKVVTQIPLTEPYQYDPTDDSKWAMQYRMSDDPTQKVHVYIFKDAQTLNRVFNWFDNGNLRTHTRCVIMILRKVGDRSKDNVWFDANTEHQLEKNLKAKQEQQ